MISPGIALCLGYSPIVPYWNVPSQDVETDLCPSLGFYTQCETVDGLFGLNVRALFWGNSVSLFVSVVDNSSNWAVCGKSSGVISMPVVAQATHRVHMEVMPLFAGYLPLPDVRLFKYLPHHSAHSSQLDAGKDSMVRGAGLLVTACSPSQGCKP